MWVNIYYFFICLAFVFSERNRILHLNLWKDSIHFFLKQLFSIRFLRIYARKVGCSKSASDPRQFFMLF